MDLVELPLKPENAKLGSEIRVIGTLCTLRAAHRHSGTAPRLWFWFCVFHRLLVLYDSCTGQRPMACAGASTVYTYWPCDLEQCTPL